MDNPIIDGGINDGLLYGLAGRVSAIESERPKGQSETPVDHGLTPLSEQYKPGLYGSYWQAISMSGVALPAVGSDWSSAFGDPSATLIHYQIPSTSGEFVMEGDTTDARLTQVAVVAMNSFVVTGRLRMEAKASNPRIQIQCNGQISEYIQSGTFSFTLRGDGQTNLIKVITNFAVGALEIRLTLWDGRTVFWLDPHSNESAEAPETVAEYGGGSSGLGIGASGAGASPGASSGPRILAGSYQAIDDLASSVVDTSPALAGTTVYGSTVRSAIVTVDPNTGDVIGVTDTAIAYPTTAAGTFSPTRSAEVNLDSNVTLTQANWLRAGNAVTVSGQFTANPTTAGLATSFEMTLPIASNIGATNDAAGVAACGTIASMSAAITGSVANNTAVVTWVATDVASQTWSYTFTYTVI